MNRFPSLQYPGATLRHCSVSKHKQMFSRSKVRKHPKPPPLLESNHVTYMANNNSVINSDDGHIVTHVCWALPLAAVRKEKERGRNTPVSDSWRKPQTELKNIHHRHVTMKESSWRRRGNHFQMFLLEEVQLSSAICKVLW